MPDVLDAPVETAPPIIKPAQPRRKTRPQATTKPKAQPPYAVVLHNDDVNGVDFVVRTLRKVFRYGLVKAIKLTMQAHFYGKAVVWSGMKEHAEFKADQLRSCGPDPMMVHKGAAALGVTIEAQAG